jgi:hypothetical protein
MASLAMSLIPAFLGSGGGGNSGLLGNITGVFGNLISGVGNTISGIGGNTNMGYNPTPKSNRKMYLMVGGLSVVMILGTVIIVVKKR